MAIDDRIGKWDAFKSIVGQKHCSGKYPGDVPDFEVKPEDVDNVYLTVKKMQRCYHGDPTYPLAQYFAQSFSKVENAYLSQDHRTFQEAVRELMMDIDAE